MTETPVVFWAVSAVMALMANTPFRVMVLRSAWIPAPPLQSLPAMDNAVFMKNLLCMNFIARQKVVPPICRGLLQPPLAAAPS